MYEIMEMSNRTPSSEEKGEHCQYDNCNQTDYLPLQCKCGAVYCRDHFMQHCLSNLCKVALDHQEVTLKLDEKVFKCFEEGCRKGNFHEMLCPKCDKHYCIEHRFHPSCPEIDDDTLAIKQEMFDAPRRQFYEANKNLQKKITENIRKSLQSTAKVKTASKIHLMRVKQKAIGPKSVPVTDRVYFAVVKPKDIDGKAVKIIQNIENLLPIVNITLDPDLKDSVPVFISSKWSLGRAIDSICENCKIANDNNKLTDSKLRLFRQIDGYCISPVKLDVLVSDLMKEDVLIEGDRLVIEYLTNEDLSQLNETSQLFLNI